MCFPFQQHRNAAREHRYLGFLPGNDVGQFLAQLFQMGDLFFDDLDTIRHKRRYIALARRIKARAACPGWPLPLDPRRTSKRLVITMEGQETAAAQGGNAERVSRLFRRGSGRT